MANYNRVMLMGNLTREPELKYINSGAAVCNFGIAINRTWMKDGQKQSEVTYVNVTVWQKQAENVAKYLRKGSPAFIEGRLQSKKWETEAGEKRTKLEVVADRVQFLPSRKRDDDHGEPAPGGNAEAAQNQSGEENQVLADDEDDVPF
jgi:single-strand DNA-binding protein